MTKRQSIQPTYDHKETGDRYTVTTHVNGRMVSNTPIRDPFIFHRVTVGWRDRLRRHLRIEVRVSGDPQIVDDVLELDADCLTFNSTRRDHFNSQLNQALSDLVS